MNVACNKIAIGSRELVALALVLLLATLLRTGWPGLVDFRSDQAHILSLALDMAQGKTFPLQGTGTSVGLPKSALSVYVYALAALLNNNPLWITWFTGAINVLAVVLCWWLTRRYWGPRAAFYAALLLTCNPWSVVYSRSVWEPNLLAPFALGYAITGARAFVEHRRWALTAHLVLLAVLVQLHYSSLVLLPVTVAFLVLCRRGVDWRSFWARLCLSILSALPFVLYVCQQGRAWFVSLTAITSRPAQVNWQSLKLWWIALTGSDLHSLAGPQAYREFLQQLPDLNVVYWTIGVLTVAAIVWTLWAWLRHAHTPYAQVGGLVSLWALGPLICLGRHSTSIYLHYYLIAIPALSILAGAFLARLATLHQTWRWATLCVAVGVAVAQTGALLTFLHFWATHATPDGLGMPLQVQMQATEQCLSTRLPVVVVSSGDDPRFSNWAAVFDVLLRDRPHRLVNGTHAALFPATPSVLLAAPDAGASLLVYSEAGVLSVARQIPTRLGEQPFYTATLTGSPTLPLTPIAMPNELINGVQFVGYRALSPVRQGQTLSWWIAWRVQQLPAAMSSTEYHIFNHLLAASSKIAQVDSPTLPLRDWAPGDLVVQALSLQVPSGSNPGPFSMHVGMYSYPELAAQPALDATGQPTETGLILGPLPQ